MAFTNASPSKYGHLVHGARSWSPALAPVGSAGGSLGGELEPPALLSVELLEGAGEAGRGLQSVSWMYYCKVCVLYVYLRARAGNEPHVCLGHLYFHSECVFSVYFRETLC